MLPEILALVLSLAGKLVVAMLAAAAMVLVTPFTLLASPVALALAMLSIFIETKGTVSRGGAACA